MDSWRRSLILLGGDVERNPGPPRSAAPPRIPPGMSLRDAESFFHAFPEAATFSVTLLDGNKRSRGHFASMSKSDLLPMIPHLLEASDGGHFFSRPLLPNLVLIDLDHCTPSTACNVYRLRPRLVTQTSVVNDVQNLQAWYVLDGRGNQGRQAAMVTKALQQALGGDPRSTAPQQQGRVAGSKNCKPALQPPQAVKILHQDPGALLAEEVFLDITPEPTLTLLHGNVEAGPPKRPSGQPAAPVQAARMLLGGTVTDASDSGRDWASAMSFFEANPHASIQSAIASIPWVATRANMQYYQKSTCEKARRTAHARLPAAPLPDTSPTRPDLRREPSDRPGTPMTPRRMARSVDALRNVEDPSRLLAAPRQLLDAIIGLSDVVACLVEKINSDDKQPLSRKEHAAEVIPPLPQDAPPGSDPKIDVRKPSDHPAEFHDAPNDEAPARQANAPEAERTQPGARTEPEGPAPEANAAPATSTQGQDARRKQKTCAACGVEKNRAEFTENQWSRSAQKGSRCKTCTTGLPEPARKTCATCGGSHGWEAFSANQRQKGAEKGLQCKSCAAKEAETTLKTCVLCGETGDRKAFSANQWEKSKEAGSRCKSCAPEERVRGQRTCVKCGATKPREEFSPNEWKRNEGEASTCRSCAMVAEEKKRRRCGTCGAEKTREDFLPNEWKRSEDGAPKCRNCSEAERGPKFKICASCGIRKPKNAYSTTQWERSGNQGSRCKPCVGMPSPPPNPDAPQNPIEPPAEEPPRTPAQRTRKQCTVCGQLGGESKFSSKQWDEKVGGPRKCNDCALPPPEVQKRCTKCNRFGTAADFSYKQWTHKGASDRKCNHCALPPAPKTIKGCTICGQTMEEDAFSRTQWERNVEEPRKCNQCARRPPPEHVKRCAICGRVGDEGSFAQAQWDIKAGDPRKCKQCSLPAAPVAQKECTFCGRVADEGYFSLKQWAKKAGDPRKCNFCALPPVSASRQQDADCGPAGGTKPLPPPKGTRNPGSPGSARPASPRPSLQERRRARYVATPRVKTLSPRNSGTKDLMNRESVPSALELEVSRRPPTPPPRRNARNAAKGKPGKPSPNGNGRKMHPVNASALAAWRMRLRTTRELHLHFSSQRKRRRDATSYRQLLTPTSRP